MFLDVAAIETMAEIAQSIDDPRVAEVVSTRPVAVAGPQQQPEGTVVEWVEATLQCIEVMLLLRNKGVFTMPGYGWAERVDGLLRPVIPAPTLAPGLHTGHFGLYGSWLSGVAMWLRPRLPKPKLIDFRIRRLRKALSPPDKDHEAVVETMFHAFRGYVRDDDRLNSLKQATLESRSMRTPPVNFDRAIELGEETYADVDSQDYYDVVFTWPLAAAYHHRGCVRWKDQHPGACTDLDRAIEIDPCARHLTTRALVAEARGEDAGSLHDRAFAALTEGRNEPDDPPDRRQRDECRTALSRAAFRHRNGDTAGAIEDLQFVKSRWAQLREPLGSKVDAFLKLLSASRA